LHRYLRWLEQVVIDLLADYAIGAGRRAGLTGVWVENRKIASIGVGVRHWITMHGFALNVTGDLSPFSRIIPCGIAEVEMTSMQREGKRVISVVDVAARFEKLVVMRMTELRAESTAAPVSA
jgi:lipoyl(octanoyl) transferase